jgi:hypothetical protein
MNKAEAAALLGVSAKTLQRGVASGKYKCTRTGTPPFTTLSFTRADLGLSDDPSYCVQCAADEDCFNSECACAVCEAASIAIDAMEPASSAVCAEVALPYQDEPVRPVAVTATPRFPIHRIDVTKHDADQNFAEAYLKGEATDSAGNRIDGTNKQWPNKGTQSLIGPQDPMPRVRPDTTSHMTPGTVGEAGNDRVENPIDSDAFAELLDPGHIERMKDLYRQCGVRPLSAQQQKERSDKLAIHAAFRWAR